MGNLEKKRVKTLPIPWIAINLSNMNIPEKKAILINSACCYVLAFLFTTILHELAHALAGSLSGSNPVMHHNYVEQLNTDHLSSSQRIGIAMAGPLTSLLQGLLAGGYFMTVKKRGLLQLFILWLSILGFNNFLGYVMTGPFFHVGDIGKTYELLHTSLSVQIVNLVLAAVGLLIVANRMSRPFLEFSYRDSWVNPGNRAVSFNFNIIMLPWIIGSVIITFLYLPMVHIVSLIYPISSGMIFIYPWQNARRVKDIRLSERTSLGKVSLKACALFIVIIIVFRWLLPPGIPI
jgi:hypothetical protein